MFISTLTRIVEGYDPYGNHRVNGLKVTYILLVLFAINCIFTIPNPYFYYFYIPMTAMAAEVIGDKLKRKNLVLFYCILWSTASAFFFDIFSISPFFPVLAFFYSLFLYLIAINSRMHVIAIAPISLSLGAYSLVYGEINTSVYTILNNSCTTLISMSIVFAALAFFPRSYYYRLWLRALLLLITQTIDHLHLLKNNQQVVSDHVRGHTSHLVRYATMLPRTFPLRALWKINLLMNRLHLAICVLDADELLLSPDNCIEKLSLFKQAVIQEKPCELIDTPWDTLNKLVHSWNYLCSKA